MTTLSRRTLLTGTVLALTAAAPATAVATADPAPVIAWNQALLRIVRTPGAQPPTVHATRSFAMTHAAMYHAARQIRREGPLRDTGQVPKDPFGALNVSKGSFATWPGS